MRDTIFERLSKQKITPLKEFKKIYIFLRGSTFYYGRTLFDFFEDEFSNYGELRKHFSSYNECLKEVCYSLYNNVEYVGYAQSEYEDINILNELE